jgi:RNA polymerase sigma-70 factor (ECF subfamily)
METRQEDLEAIGRCQHGDIQGLEPLVLHYQTQAMRVAYLIVNDLQIAEDSVQDSFLTVYHRIKTFDSTRPFAPWFYRIVANTVRQKVREARRHLMVSLSQVCAPDSQEAGLDWPEPCVTSWQDNPVVQAERAMERSAMVAALSELTIKQREAIVLRYYCDCTDQEMAHFLHCLPATARWRLHSGLRALERLIRYKFPVLLQEPEFTDPITTAKEVSCAGGKR